MSKPVKKAIIPVAGFGTRMLPATKSIPKELMPLVDRPLLQYIVDEVKEAGIEQCIFITNRGKGAIEDYFDMNYELNRTMEDRGKTKYLEMMKDQTPTEGDMVFIRQKDPRGVGHAIWCARHLIHDEPFAVLFPDDIILNGVGCMKQMVDDYQSDQMMLAVEEVPLPDTEKYGILDVSEKCGNLVHAKGIIEKPKAADAPSRMAVVGRYILPADIIPILKTQETGAGGEVHVTDALNKLLSTHRLVGYQFDGRRFDCGGHAGYLEATVAAALDRNDLKDTMRDILAKYQ